MSGLNRRFFDALMAEKKLSLRALAAKIGMNHSQLSLTFSGARKMQLDEAAQLSHVFSVPLHKIVEAAGVTVKPVGGGRVKVIGAMRGNGTVELHDKSTVERTTAPDDMPKGSIAVQCRTSGTDLEWADGFVLFCKEPGDLESGILGRFCLAQIKDGPAVVALVKRGYREGTFNLAGPYQQESVTLDWATPVLITRN